MYYVYILKSKKDRSHYTGITSNLEKRLKSHNWRENTYSKSKTPFELVWFCGFTHKIKALNFEKYLKSGSGFAFARKRLTYAR